MAGVRLYHPTIRSQTYTVETVQVYPVPYACNLCNKLHVNKSIHLRIDDSGHVIVAPEVYDKLLTLTPNGEMGNLQTVGEVAQPPPLNIGAVVNPQQEIVDAPLNHQHSTRFYIPGYNQYVARDRMFSRIRVPKLRFLKRNHRVAGH